MFFFLLIPKYEGLEADLNTKLHGQHLVGKSVLDHVKKHFENSSPSKALVLSFHGPTGVGKSHVARIIAANMYEKGIHTNCVHFINGINEFPGENDWEKSEVS